MGKPADISGQKFNRLLAVEYAHTTRHGQRMWRCVCDCGKDSFATASTLRRGDVKSCGCLHTDVMRVRNTTHGGSQSGTYSSWKSMLSRCDDKQHIGFHNYGGRGITICDRWRSFVAFHEDMGDRPKGLTIERIDNSGNYELGNCRWATRKEQCNNRRGNALLTHGGETLTVSQWADRIGCPAGTLVRRLGAGWDDSATVTTPVDARYRRAKHPEKDVSTRMLTHGGETLLDEEWSRRLGGKGTLVRGRIAIGWTVERAVTTPADTRCHWHDLSRRTVTHGGETLTVAEWSLRLGGCKDLVASRLESGWSEERAVTVPVDPYPTITHAGETLTMGEWSRRLGGTKILVRARIDKGWDEVRAVTTPCKPYRPRAAPRRPATDGSHRALPPHAAARISCVLADDGGGR
jgi:hypothetical protein